MTGRVAEVAFERFKKAALGFYVRSETVHRTGGHAQTTKVTELKTVGFKTRSRCFWQSGIQGPFDHLLNHTVSHVH